MQKILVLSDLHLDHSNFTPQTENADIIVLAGDIAGRNSLIEDFFYYRIPRDKPTIYVAGNHEYEHHDFQTKNEYLKDICKEFGVHYLFNERIDINGIRFLGTPLFSNLSGFYNRFFPNSERAKIPQEDLIEWVQNTISDFKLIQHKNSVEGEGRWTISDMFAHFNQAYNFLKEELEKDFDGKTVTITHFAPLFDFSKLNVPEKDYPKNSYWANHIPELVELSDFWICGHTHTPKTVTQGKCQVVCNPRGYNSLANIPENANFINQKILEV